MASRSACCCGLAVHAKPVVACLLTQDPKERRPFATMPDGCRSHIDVGTLRPSAPGYAGACEGRLTGHRHSGIRVLSHAPLLPEGSPHARIAEPCPVVQ